MDKKMLLISILLVLFLSSCGVLQIKQPDSLNGTSWTLISINGEGLIKDTAMTAFFEDGQVNGSASCNHYFGSYTIKGDQLQVEGLGWTEMACLNPDGIMEQEQQLMSMFSQTGSISIQGQLLQAATTTGDVMIFQRTEARK